MSDVNSITGLASSATLREYANQPFRRPDSANRPAYDDTVEISALAAFLGRLSELPEDRARRIVNIRNAIIDGTYETEDKLDIATDRLLEAIHGDEGEPSQVRAKIA